MVTLQGSITIGVRVKFLLKEYINKNNLVQRTEFP